MEESIFTELLAQLEERFLEMDSEITIALPVHDLQYAALRARLKKLERQFPFIESVLDSEGTVRLTAEDHAGLVEFLRTTDEAENRERLNLYLAGHRDCLTYLKRIGLL